MREREGERERLRERLREGERSKLSPSLFLFRSGKKNDGFFFLLSLVFLARAFMNGFTRARSLPGLVAQFPPPNLFY